MNARQAWRGDTKAVKITDTSGTNTKYVLLPSSDTEYMYKYPDVNFSRVVWIVDSKRVLYWVDVLECVVFQKVSAVFMILILIFVVMCKK